MKRLLVAAVLVSAWQNAPAQTNAPAGAAPIVFSELLSTNESGLMTNAEFRCTQGLSVFFRSKDGSDYERFNAGEIDTNQLARMGLVLAKLRADQARLDAARQRYAQEVAQARQLAAEQAQAAEQSTNQTAAGSTNSPSSSTPSSTPERTHRRRYR